MRLACEVVDCMEPQAYDLVIWVNGDRGNYPKRKLCDSCAAKAVNSGRVVSLRHQYKS